MILLSVNTEPSFEEFKEKGLPMNDYCEICDEGDNLFYVLEKGPFRYYCCHKCKSVSSY